MHRQVEIIPATDLPPTLMPAPLLLNRISIPERSTAPSDSAASLPKSSRRDNDENCAHCGLPVPLALQSATGPHFCCHGCAAVYDTLHQAGLLNYYTYRDRLLEGQPTELQAVLEPTSFVFFDTPTFEAEAVELQSTGKKSVEVDLEGLHCAACVWLLERLPRLDPAVECARVDLAARTLRVDWDPKETTLSRIATEVQRLGYRMRPRRGRVAQGERRKELRRLLTRVGVAGASAGNVMLLAFALYSGRLGDGAGSMSEEVRRLFDGASLFVSLPSLWAAGLFFRGAWAALRMRVPHMDLPISLGIGAGYIFSIGAAWSGHEMYLDSITTLIFLLLVGRYIQSRHQLAHAEATELALAVTPAEAEKLEGPDAIWGSGIHISTAELAPRDYVEVRRGQTVPIDGVVVRGASTLDLSLLSGESLPVPIGVGDRILAGSINLTGSLVVQVESVGADSRAGRLMRQVERALAERAPIVQAADRLAGTFTWLVIIAALLTFLVGAATLGPLIGLQRALALLVVACPCALGMATPLSLSAAITQAARQRMLIKGTGTLEALATQSLIVFDKTGTLTEGELSVIRFVGPPAIAALIRQAEIGSNHPVARALARDLPDDGAPLALSIDTQREEPAQGVSLETSGGLFRIGAEGWLRRLQVDFPPSIEEELQRPELAHCSPVLVAQESQVIAVAWLEDRMRPDAPVALRRLATLGYELGILSGDNPRAVDALRARLDPESTLFRFAEGGMTPEAKLARVRALQEQAPTLMVGDGINDAGALAAARVGIAVARAAEASLLSADVYLANAGVGRVVELIEGARRALRTVHRGLALSLVYNAVGVTLAAFGYLTPLGAALLMPLSSLTVVTNAYRSRTYDLRRNPTNANDRTIMETAS